MPEPTPATYRFFSWLRQGLLAGLSNQAAATPSLTSGHLVLPIRLRVNSAAPVDVNVQLYGPGDITGIDAREVIRTEPHRQMTDFEPNYFPAIEFDRPDFPWLFTPATADTARRLRPWICLIVLRKEGAALSTVPHQPLPVITCGREELPDLDQAWAWAHAQIVTGDTTASTPSLQQILKDHPERTLSRLLGARRLDPNTAYYACLVPTYDVGRKAGLGEPITTDDEQALKPAWSKGPDAPTGNISLPVYFHWEFRTGQAGDFESLARRLTPKPLPTTVGLRPMDIRTPGWGMPALPTTAPGSVLDLGGALRTPETNPRPWPEAAQTSFQQALRTILNEPAAHASTNNSPAVLGPPLYGQWYTDQQTVPTADQPPNWFRELNLDPRHRVAAGVGTQVIRYEQEPLMASAWDQLEQQRQDNARRKRAQLAETVGNSLLNKHLSKLDPTRLLQLTGPVFTGMTGLATTNLPVDDASRQLLSNPAVSGAFRRLTRARGPISARMGASQPAGTVATTPQTQPGTVALFAAAATTRRAPTVNAWTAVKAEVLMRLNPKEAVLAAVRESQPETENTDLIRFAPTFPQPMYEAMRDYFPDMLLPGMGLVPQNSIALLKTNPELIEAYMVGLNHEMSRELLWRGFPTDQRGTYFRQFWDAGGDQPPTNEAERESRRDITSITSWTADSRLGTHGARGSAIGQMVLLIRGDLLRRYPRAIVYALESVWSADGTRRELGTTERYPIFRATQSPDITMLGFPLTEDQVRGADTAANGGHAGWFFVLQEQPTEPRFGMDVAKTYGGTPQHWSDLTWGHLAPDEVGLKQIVYVPIDGLLKNAVVDQIPWGKNSAHMASITRQPPFRVAVHARTWLP
ncbi:MAG: hypothetical protein MRJ92_17405 [Nitrospira sp.]|nr:hypothetical protein [Nitrospira sp.]MDR4481410.1 hypothetical protein [Nitrospira sp.]